VAEQTRDAGKPIVSSVTVALGNNECQVINRPGVDLVKRTTWKMEMAALSPAVDARSENGYKGRYFMRASSVRCTIVRRPQLLWDPRFDSQNRLLQMGRQTRSACCVTHAIGVEMLKKQERCRYFASISTTT
jgi:hypothetical protein